MTMTDLVTLAPESQPQWVPPAVALVIESHEQYAALAEHRGLLKTFLKDAKAWFAPLKEAAHKAHAAICQKERDVLAPAEADDKAWGEALEVWDRKQDAIRQAEQRRLSELARQEEERRRLEEAAALESEAIRTGDAEMAAVAEEIMAAPVAAVVVSVPKATPVVAGLSYRDNWVAASINVAVLVKAAANEPSLLSYLLANESAINKVVSATKGQIKIPGVTVENRRVVSQRGR